MLAQGKFSFRPITSISKVFDNNSYRKLDQVMDGRRSFPSGHSSTAFSGMTFLSLYLAGLTGAWCFSQAARPGSFFGSRMARLWLTAAPVVFATWVAITRLEDYVRSFPNPPRF